MRKPLRKPVSGMSVHTRQIRLFDGKMQAKSLFCACSGGVDPVQVIDFASIVGTFRCAAEQRNYFARTAEFRGETAESAAPRSPRRLGAVLLQPGGA